MIILQYHIKDINKQLKYGGKELKSKEPKSLIDVFKLGALGLVFLLFIAKGVEGYRADKREKERRMLDILTFTDMYYNYKTEPIEAWLKVDESYMPDREKLNTYFKDEIKVNKEMYKDENTTIYLDTIKGDDNSFLKFYFKKKDKVEKNKGELVTIAKEIKEHDRTFFSDHKNIPQIYDKEGKIIGNVSLYSEFGKSEDFTISVKKENLIKMNWPISFKMDLTKVSYERKPQ